MLDCRLAARLREEKRDGGGGRSRAGSGARARGGGNTLSGTRIFLAERRAAG